MLIKYDDREHVLSSIHDNFELQLFEPTRRDSGFHFHPTAIHFYFYTLNFHNLIIGPKLLPTVLVLAFASSTSVKDLHSSYM